MQKREVLLAILIFFLVSPVSAGWFSDFLGKVSGKTVDSPITVEVEYPSQFPQL